MQTLTVLVYFNRKVFGRVFLDSCPSSLNLPKGDDIQVTWKAITVTGSPHPVPQLRAGDVVSSDKMKYQQLTSSNAAQIDAIVLNSQPVDMKVTIPADYGQGGNGTNGDTTIRNRGVSLTDLVIKIMPAFLAGLVAGLVVGSMLHLSAGP